MKRKIAALLVGDVVGYSSMMERAEERTVERLSACHALIARNVDFWKGGYSKLPETLHSLSFQARSTRCERRSRYGLR